MAYRVSFRASADKSLDKLPKAIQVRCIAAAQALAGNPRPSGSKKLVGSLNLWRLRVGDWRMVYLIDDSSQSVDIRIVAHRREVYRGL